MASESWYANLEHGEPIEVFALTEMCNEDSFPDKVNLGSGGEW